MSNGTKVKKRDGRIEPLDLDKMHLMVDEACQGLAGVSASQVEMKSGIQFYDGITTEEIQEILIRAASDLIDLDHPNYQFVVQDSFCLQFVNRFMVRCDNCPVLNNTFITVLIRKYMILKYSQSILKKKLRE